MHDNRIQGYAVAQDASSPYMSVVKVVLLPLPNLALQIPLRALANLGFEQGTADRCVDGVKGTEKHLDIQLPYIEEE